MINKRQENNKVEHTHISLRITDFECRVDSSVNHEIMDKRYRYDDTPVYSCGTHINLTTTCNYPDELDGHIYEISISPMDSGYHRADLKLKDCQAHDDAGEPKFKRTRGIEVPVYDIRDTIGFIEKRRGEDRWDGAVWVQQEALSDMLTLLGQRDPLYVALHQVKKGRHRGVRGISLQTTDPAEE